MGLRVESISGNAPSGALDAMSKASHVDFTMPYSTANDGSFSNLRELD